ncbi:hypothetical protein GQ44DRAFT_776339 [Phaeosphaeriaceae sp. PMI808]|nr:hypothetical protein GQ44DRAFT_776339 [Phaeosphaeriaceae sp. PMI808]
MANNNYSQPYYGGAPFHYPPRHLHQPPPPHTPSDIPGTPQDMQHPPPMNPFYLPGLQHAPSPSANNQAAYTQNNQQPLFPSAAWPPPDPNAWFTLMQTAAVNGQPPPPLPGFVFPQPFPPTPSRLPTVPPGFPPTSSDPTVPLPLGKRKQEVMGSDREEGEVSDGEVAPRVNGRSHPEPPRSVPQVKRVSPPVEEAYNPDQPAAGQLAMKESRRKTSQQAAMPTVVDTVQENRDQAKQFIKLLHSHNIGYRTLAKESLDLEQLRGLYQSLNLPSEPAPILPPRPPIEALENRQQASSGGAIQPVLSSHEKQQKPAPTIKTSINAGPSPTSAPSPVDRKDYIARLQAAKLAKQSAAAKPSLPPKMPVTAVPPTHVAPAANTPQPAVTPTVKPPVTDEQRARTTELIKQRLEAIKAKKQMAPAVNGTTPAQWPTEQAAQPSPNGTTTPSDQPHLSAFPGIPGLFMNPPPVFDTSAPKTTPSIPQKRPAPSDTEFSTPRGSVTPYTRPLGDSPRAYHEESMIIQVSDDESNGSEMDIDEEQTHSKPAIVSQSTNAQRQGHGTLSDFPSRPLSAFPGSSAVSTPGPQTPATQIREKELKRKEDELAAMKLTLKRKLAEKREKDKALAAAAASSPHSLSAQSMPVESGSTLSSVLRDANELISDVKRRRREEIQSKLPSFDAELAINTSKMAQLMKDMEELRAQNLKITEDKERLTRELENLGVDTEGMSHAEMRAKKEEIQHEMVPEYEKIHGGEIIALDPVHSPITNQEASETEEAPRVAKLPNVSQIPEQHAILPGLGNGAQRKVEEVTAPSKATTIDEDSRVVGASVIANSAAAAPHAPGFTTPLDEDDFYSPAPPVGVNGSNTVELEDKLQTQAMTQATSPLSEEVEMSLASEDEEEEYVPEEPMITADPPTQKAHFPEAKATSSVMTDDVSTEDEEAYEPPDIEEEIPNTQLEDGYSEADVATNQLEVGDEAMDIASSSSDDSDSDSDSDMSSQAGNVEITPAHRAIQQQPNIPNDLAQEVQPGPELLPGPEPEPEPATHKEEEVPKFTPYESPLRIFKSYRYHPNFAADVPGGFLSNTYSHQIDAEKPMCQYETAGGTCNDPDCVYQHFNSTGITGETLLVQLGTANPGKTPEEKQQWNDGLRGVLKELRKKSIKDPNGIAAEIAKYRRQFLDDDTRVVNL